MEKTWQWRLGDDDNAGDARRLGPDGPRPFFFVNGWDPDDVLLDDCAHSDVIEDPFGLIGCAEHALEKAVFTGSARGNEIVDDELYAMYVDALEIVVAELTEERIGALYDESAEELITFAADPAIVEVMPDWRNEDDVPAEWKPFTPINAEFFNEDVSGIGSPGGAAKLGVAAALTTAAGAAAYLAAGLLVMYGLEPLSTPQVVLEAPLGLQEIALALWLILKGFDPQVAAPPVADRGYPPPRVST